MRIRNSCSFTGHRNLPKDKIEEIKELTRHYIILLIELGIEHFYTGGAIGYDTLVAGIVIELKKIYPNIKLHMCLPYKYTNFKFKVYPFCNFADSLEYASDKYTPTCLMERNRLLVDHSDIIICFMENNKSGTGSTVAYAKSKGLNIKNIALEL